jgi:hypothetical protein
MAPRKKTEEKEKPAAKTTTNEATDMIVEYLREWCVSLMLDGADFGQGGRSE